jgi:hypothetical protein
VADSPASAADRAALLERFSLRPQAVPTVAAASEAQRDLGLARISAFTDVLRVDAASDDATTRLTMRLLLADLGLISAWLRAEANESAAALTRVLHGASRES